MKLYSVQYMRGLAAFLVVLAHSLQHPLAKGSNYYFIRLGSLGVFLFFVISGFIMVFVSGVGTFRPVTFLERRAIRIVPLYWVATASVAILGIVAPGVFKTTVFALPHFLLSLLFIPHYAPGGELSPLLKLGWTLNYEMFFYVSFAALAFLAAGPRVLALTILFALLAIAGVLHDFSNALLHFYTGSFLLAFCAGTWIALAMLHGRIPAVTPAAVSALVLIAALFTVGGFLVEPGTLGGPLTTLCFSVGSAAFLLLGLMLEKRLPVWRLPMLLGDASYSMYLVHIYCVAGGVAVLHKLSPTFPFWPMVAFTTILGTAAGIVVHLLVEKPLLRLLQSPSRRPASAPESPIAPPVDGLSPALMPDTHATHP